MNVFRRRTNAGSSDGTDFPCQCIKLVGKRSVRTKAKLRDAANDHMVLLERSPERVRSYFQDQRVRVCRLKLYRAGSIIKPPEEKVFQWKVRGLY